MLGRKPIFNGSEGADGSMSLSISGSNTSFTVEKALPIINIKCSTTASYPDRFASLSTNTKHLVKCPKDCSYNTTKIFGTDIYSDNSSICKAAIHRGIINDQGGEVLFMITAGENYYKKSNGFGVNSSEYGPNIRSFTFLGKSSAIEFEFVENYLGDIKKKWKQEVFDKASLLSYLIDPHFLNSRGFVEKLKAIQIINKNKYSIQNRNSWQSLISLKNAEFANGTVLFNLRFVYRSVVGFFIRYKDKHNYYSITFDASTSAGKITLMKKVNGK